MGLQIHVSGLAYLILVRPKLFSSTIAWGGKCCNAVVFGTCNFDNKLVLSVFHVRGPDFFTIVNCRESSENCGKSWFYQQHKGWWENIGQRRLEWGMGDVNQLIVCEATLTGHLALRIGTGYQTVIELRLWSSALINQTGFYSFVSVNIFRAIVMMNLGEKLCCYGNQIWTFRSLCLPLTLVKFMCGDSYELLQ